jgi:hypothetical protein
MHVERHRNQQPYKKTPVKPARYILGSFDRRLYFRSP